MIQVYKYMNEKYHNKDLFEISSEERTRGHRLKLFKPRCRTNIRQNFFTVRVIEDWNSLPEEVIEAKNVNTFKNRLDAWWENQLYEYDD